MKKVLAIILVLCMCISLCACVSMDKFEKNLEDDYKISKMRDSDLETYEKLLDLDADDYDLETVKTATHKKSGIGVYIFECGSAAKAKQLAEDAEDMVDILESTYASKYSFDMVVKGRFVLVGEEDAIEDALGK